MAIVSLPTLLNGTRLFVSNSPPKLTPQARNSYSPTTNHKNIRTRICACAAKCHPQFLHQPLIETSFSSRHRGLLPLVPSNAKTSSGSGEEDNRAVETVLKLYTSIKNKNIRELSDIIGDECRCVCNFFSFFQPFQGKQQVLDFFKILIKFLGNNFEFVVQPTFHDGLNEGSKWRLGEGTRYTTNYSKLAMLSWPSLALEQDTCASRKGFQLLHSPSIPREDHHKKMMGFAMSIVEKMSSCKLSRDKVKKAVLVLVLLAVILIFLMPGMY
ncbi:hypothetical protein NC652_035893 [Populus alba x Populus x berolinensis]|nr:hypothetical protein NC652_035760 [Populus alba x Populus x berolinensis]KAJ6869973.1 hypothetical protein NC652_035777 [Populus alba x Populus x berolinensis]KAJ6870120.1 hypothetical protein NC652_035893 [Populus alba x Populus x berolinensis]